MKSLRFLDRRAGFSLGAVGLLVGMVAPATLPMFASAAQVGTRSIELSSSAAGGTNVTYEVKFTPATNAGAFVLDFCNDSPIYGQSCTAPVGFNASGAATSSSGASIGTLTTPANSQVEVVDAMTASTPVDVVLTGITNPTSATTSSTGFYARIVTFDTQAHANDYASSGTNTGKEDDGGVAMAITDSIGVTATVKETMTFCVAGSKGTVLSNGGANGPSGNCGVDGGASATGLDTAHLSLALGHGTPTALDSSAVDTDSDWAQISTNASAGAVVRMTNTNGGNCSGLFRTGASGCDIAGVGDTAAAITAGNAFFGMLLGSPTSAPNSSATPTGAITTLAPYTGASSLYGMGTGVTSTYGDPVFNTGGAPIANKNVQLTFAAAAAPTTPAGVYQATMNLIATGTF